MIELKNYFQSLADQHVGIEKMVMGDVRVMAGEVLKSLKNVCLWLDLPDELISLGANGKVITYETGYTVFRPVRLEDHEATHAAWNETSSIAHDIMNRMVADSRKREHFTGFKVGRMMPIDSTFVSNCVGWHVDFTVQQIKGECINLNVWNNA